MVSLIVPVYNVKPYIEEFLDSVARQTFTDYEVLLVDDGSFDGTQFILDDYAKNNEKFKVVHKTNGGVVSAWKKGIEESKGEYITFADPDDIMDPKAIETQYNLMVANNVDFVITGFKRLENNELKDAVADYWSLQPGLYTGEKLEFVKQNLFGNTSNKVSMFFFAKWNKLFKREIVLNNLKYSRDDISFGDDVAISASAIYDSNGFYYSAKPLYIYRIRNDSLTTVNFKENQIDDAENLIGGIRTLVSEKGYMNDFVYFNDHSYHLLRLMHKIKMQPTDKKTRIEMLRTLAKHDFSISFRLKEARKLISHRRYIAIWLLQHSMLNILYSVL